jgi:hypothetical protein
MPELRMGSVGMVEASGTAGGDAMISAVRGATDLQEGAVVLIVRSGPGPVCVVDGTLVSWMTLSVGVGRCA